MKVSKSYVSSDFDHILEKKGEKLFKGGYYSRENTNQGNTALCILLTRNLNGGDWQKEKRPACDIFYTY